MPKVTDLTESLTIADTDFLYAVVGGNSRKVKKGLLSSSVPVSLVKLQSALAAAGQTELPFTGIPTWVNRVTVSYVNLSTNGTSPYVLQVGNGAYVTTGYLGSATAIAGATPSSSLFTNGCGLVQSASAATTVRGRCTLERHSGNVWAMSGVGSASNTAATLLYSSEITLAGDLDRLRITTSGGTDTFDTGGSVAISWE